MDEIDIDDDVVNDDNIDFDNLHWQEIPIWDPTLLETRNGTINRSSSIPVFDETTSGPNIRYIHRIHRTQKSKNSISAIDCLLCYFTTPIMFEFVNSTNSFGKLFLNKWKDTILSEFMIFFAIILSLGIMRFPNRDIIWESVNFGSSWIRNLMTQRRFSDLLRAWHYEDYSKYTSNEIGELKKRDPFWSVKTISKIIANAFQNVFHCGQLLDVDEQTVPWKGRHRCRCYNPNKPDKWHFKIFALNDSNTGYMTNFYLYEGAAENRDGVSATLYPIIKLLNHDIYKGKRHIVATDNWYTSIDALKFVKSINAEYVGTIKTNKRGLPQEGIFPKKGRGKKARGVMKQMSCDLNGYKAYLNAWMDNKPVHILSTMRSYKTTVTRMTSDANKKNWRKIVYDCPDIIKQYNKTMGGTDAFDQKLSYYKPKVKTISWQPRILIHLLNAAVTNGHILFKAYNKVEISHLDFRQLLIKELISYNTNTTIDNESDIDDTNQINSRHTTNRWLNDHSRLCGQHFPVIEEVEVVESGITRKSRRGTCLLCGCRINTKCQTCGTYLCIKSNGKDTCWKHFHSKPNFF